MDPGARARTSSAPASTSFCPACEKPVDSLRAGQVAILDGAFRYFCDAECKNAYVDAVSKRPALDAMTAEPPAVMPASAARSTAPPPVVVLSPETLGGRAPSEPFFPPVTHAASGVRDQGATDREDVPEVEMAEASVLPAVAPDSERPRPEAREELPDEDELAAEGEEAADDASPSTLRSPSVTELEAAALASAPSESAPTSSKQEASLSLVILAGARVVLAHVVAAGPIAGVIAGVLAAVVSLAGEPAGVLRLPLALTAAAIVFAMKGLAPRERSEPSPFVIVGPIGVAAVLATISAFANHIHADAHASFVGLAAASALAVDILLVRARREILASRARTVQALAVTARVVGPDNDAVPSRAREPEGRSSLNVTELDAALVKPGEQVIVEAGETIPVDGIVTTGEAEVAPWLDSPALVPKAEGDAVVALSLIHI